MTTRHPLTALLAAALLAVALPARAGTTIDLAAEGSRAVANDLARATVFAEASGNTPGDLAKKVNTLIGDGLRLAKSFPAVKARSGPTYTHPAYAKGGRIESWRMRSEIVLESTDVAALSELLGRLQASLGVGQLLLMPADETRRRAEEEATLDAIASFRDRAAKVAAALGKAWRIKHLSLNTPDRPPVMPMRATTMMATAEAPMPIDAGESRISVNVSGQIELAD